jgi:hypothetical protein
VCFGELVFFEFGTAKVSDCYKRLRLFLYQWFKKMYRVMSGKKTKPSRRDLCVGHRKNQRGSQTTFSFTFAGNLIFLHGQ